MMMMRKDSNTRCLAVSCSVLALYFFLAVFASVLCIQGYSLGGHCSRFSPHAKLPDDIDDVSLDEKHTDTLSARTHTLWSELEQRAISTHVSTDKPIYRLGESVRWRAVIVDAVTQRIVTPSRVDFVVKGPSGEQVAQVPGVAGGDRPAIVGSSWPIPTHLSGGEYTIEVRVDYGTTPAVRKIQIRDFSVPRMNLVLSFLSQGYSAGEEVQAQVTAQLTEGGVPKGAAVTAYATVNGSPIDLGATTHYLDHEGKCTISFTLPNELGDLQGLLSVTVNDNGVVETTAKTIPLVANRVDLQFYPESGCLVSELPSTVYFDVLSRSGEPLDIEGDVIHDSIGIVAHLCTVHEGRGRFNFTPKAALMNSNGGYYVRISSPSSLAHHRYALPSVEPEGAVIHSRKEVYSADELITIDVHVKHDPDSNHAHPTSQGMISKILGLLNKFGLDLKSHHYHLLLYKKHHLVHNVTLSQDVQISSITAELQNAVKASGTLRVLLCISASPKFVLSECTPLAERLVFVKPVDVLTMQVNVSRLDSNGNPGPALSTFVPGDVVVVSVRALNSTGSPVPSVLGVTVTDDAALQMVEPRKQAPRLPVMVMLEDEVKHLEDAQFMLHLLSVPGKVAGVQAFHSKNVSAESAMDLLLGTQGWRRFAYHFLDQFVDEEGDAAKRMLSHSPIPHGDQFLFEGIPMRLEMAMAAGAEFGAAPPDDGAVQNVRVLRAGSAPVARARVAKARKLPVNRHFVIPGPAVRPRVGQMRIEAERVYAHVLRPDRTPGSREDFTETVYWSAGTETDGKGEARMTFALSDSITTLRVSVDGYAIRHDVAKKEAPGVTVFGSYDHTVQVKTPFYVEVRLPLEVASGDQVIAPISIVNSSPVDIVAHIGASVAGQTDNSRSPSNTSSTSQSSLQLTHPEAILDVSVSANRNARQFVQFTAISSLGEDRVVSSVMLNVTTEPQSSVVKDSPDVGHFTDHLVRSTKVMSRGFPASVESGGVLDFSSTQSVVVSLPPRLPLSSTLSNLTDGFFADSLRAHVRVYPAPTASILQAVSRLLQEPGGCFEQTSATTFPATMALQYFKSHSGVDPELITKAQGILERGYQRLTTFESPNKGFEWFGGDPGHEALTAMGLHQFVEMKRVMPSTVSKSLIDRTAQWLLSRQNPILDGKSSIFLRNDRALDTFGRAAPEITDAYIVYSLTFSDVEVPNMSRYIEILLQRTTDSTSPFSRDAYYLGLVAASLHNLKRESEALPLVRRIVENQQEDGSVARAAHSITMSMGASLLVETTSIALINWLHYSEFTPNVERALRFLVGTCKDGMFVSTQGTVLALRAIIAYDNSRSSSNLDQNSVSVQVNGREVGNRVVLSSNQSEALSFDGITQALLDGSSNDWSNATITLRLHSRPNDPSSAVNVKLPFSVSVEYRTPIMPSDADSPVQLHVRLLKTDLMEGEGTQLLVDLENVKRGEGLPMVTAIVGLPGGMEARFEKLQELVKAQTISYFEMMGSRDLVLYWRQLAPNAKLSFPLDVVAAVPGKYTGNPSRAYLYYTPELQSWTQPLVVNIQPRT